MNRKRIVLAVLLTAVISLTIGYERGWAQNGKEIAPALIGVVGVDDILQKSTRHVQWQHRMEAQSQKNQAELQKIVKEIEMIRADMDTRKQGSDDYLKLARKGIEKQATLEATQKYYEQETALKIQQWTSGLYQDIIRSVEKVAQARGLDLVLAKEDLTIPTVNVRELMTLIRTSKVLFNADELDITDEVLAAVDLVK